jgi:hypothetical protein
MRDAGMGILELRRVDAGPREDIPDRDAFRAELCGQRREAQQVLGRGVEVARDWSHEFDRLHEIDSSGTNCPMGDVSWSAYWQCLTS